jgi:hypothetical protein
MNKNIFFALACCAASFASQAGLIEYKDYSRETTSTVVKTKHLQWLQWDQTRGMSIQTALATYGSAGWTLASTSQMVALFNQFKFGHPGWVETESKNQVAYDSWSSSENSSQNAFLRLFGVNRSLGCDEITDPICYPAQDAHEETFAFFGSDANQNDRFNLASVRDDLTEISPDGIVHFDAFSRLSPDNFRIDQSFGNVGVALVRANNTSAVISVPASSGLLLLGFSALLWWRRR